VSPKLKELHMDLLNVSNLFLVGIGCSGNLVKVDLVLQLVLDVLPEHSQEVIGVLLLVLEAILMQIDVL